MNEAWKGKRYKTKKYKCYEAELLYTLPLITIPAGELAIIYEVAYSNKASDIDNFLKSFQDILQKKYNFDDKDIYFIQITKKIVKKGGEYISFEVLPYEKRL